MKDGKASPNDEEAREQLTEDVIAEPEPDKARPLDRWLQNLKHRQERDRRPSLADRSRIESGPCFWESRVWPLSSSFYWECFQLPSV